MTSHDRVKTASQNLSKLPHTYPTTLFADTRTISPKIHRTATSSIVRSSIPASYRVHPRHSVAKFSHVPHTGSIQARSPPWTRLQPAFHEEEITGPFRAFSRAVSIPRHCSPASSSSSSTRDLPTHVPWLSRTRPGE